MGIPAAATTIEILRPRRSPDLDPYDAPVRYVPVEGGVRAVISSPSGSRVARVAQGTSGQETEEFRLVADVCDLQGGDIVEDGEGTRYTCTWAKARVGFGVDHVAGVLRRVEGVVAGG